MHSNMNLYDQCTLDKYGGDPLCPDALSWEVEADRFIVALINKQLMESETKTDRSTGTLYRKISFNRAIMDASVDFHLTRDAWECAIKLFESQGWVAYHDNDPDCWRFKPL
jgi:hypothetical protein